MVTLGLGCGVPGEWEGHLGQAGVYWGSDGDTGSRLSYTGGTVTMGIGWGILAERGAILGAG